MTRHDRNLLRRVKNMRPEQYEEVYELVFEADEQRTSDNIYDIYTSYYEAINGPVYPENRTLFTL